jgi:hypothetical protein
MNTEPSISDIPLSASPIYDRSLFPSLCWGAIIAGTIAAMGIHLLLSALGVGAGLASFTPMSDADPVENFSVGAAVVWTVCALIALSFGGLIAGRFSHSLHSGFVHGVLVWCLTMIFTVLLLSMGTGMVLGGALKFLGEGLAGSGKALAVATGTAAEAGIKRGTDQVESFIDEALHSGPTNSAASDLIRAKREIGFSIAKLFSQGNDPASKSNRLAAVKSLTSYAGMSEADATKTVDDWSTSYQRLKAELESDKAIAQQKARQAADRAASNLSCAAIWSFFALLLGLLVAALSASCGARRALRWAEIRRVPENVERGLVL